MTRSGARVLAGLMFTVSVLLALGGAVFLVLGRSVPVLPNEFGVKGDSIALALLMGGVGLIIAVRLPRNAIGWIFCGLGIVSGIVAFSSAYARWALIAEGGRPPGGLFAASLQEWVWMPLVLGLGMIAAIFPDGRFLSRGWRAALWIAAGLSIVPMITNALIPHLTIYRGYDNPMGAGGSTMQDLAPASIIAVVPVILLGMASAIVRFRRSRGEERLQLKWLMLSVVALASLISFYGVTTLISPGEGSIIDHDWVEYLAVLAFLSMPVAIAFGVLRYRLYDIDVVVNKAVVYGAMAVFITVVYVAVVVGVGAAVGTTGDAALSAVAAAVVALAFQPVRRQMQRLANRIVYGERATPYEVLADLGERLAAEYDVEDVVVRVASTLATGVAAERVVVWLQVGRELRPAGAWPIDARAARIPLSDGEVPTELDGLRAFPVFHQGEPLGAIGVGKPAADPITPSDEKLIGDFAAQAGLVLRNVRLIEDLRASRQRLVAAQDEERRRIERNIHDGAQQQLVALAVKLRLADTVLGRDEERARCWPSSSKTPPRRSRTCATSPVASTLPCSRIRGSCPRSRRRRAAPRSPSRSARTGSAATRGRSRRPSTSARSSRCRTSGSTRRRTRSRSISRSATARCTSPCATTGWGSTSAPRTDRASRTCATGWTRSAARSRCVRNPGKGRRSRAGSRSPPADASLGRPSGVLGSERCPISRASSAA